jgi:hypothetical protein
MTVSLGDYFYSWNMTCVVYKLGRFHIIANALSQFLNSKELIGVLDQTTMLHCFYYNMNG